jgi:2-(1,2-epoxy-1,2-dihydrophenyl)acetyl-CoA isomerase
MDFLKRTNKEIELNFKEHVLWLTLKRPEASNAFTTVMIDELVQTLYSADSANEVRCIVITGSGKHFCAGGDVKQMQNKEGMFAGEPNELRERYKRGIQQIPLCFRSLSTPVIAMVNGAAIGAGLDLACMCDIRIASEKAKFGETFAKLGLIPGDGGSYFLQRIVGFAKAMEMTLTADVYNAEQALAMGLVSKVVTLEELQKSTEEIVNKILSNAPIAIQMAKRSIQHAYHNDLDSTLDLLAAYQGITQRSSDHFAGLKGLQEKSKADFNHE